MSASTATRPARGDGGAQVADRRAAAPPWLGWVALALAAATIAASWAVGRWLQSEGFRLFTTVPPLTGRIDPRSVIGAVAPLAVAAVVATAGPRVAARASWRIVLLASAGAALAWSASLAAVDGSAGFLDPVRQAGDYLAAVPSVGSPGPFLDGFVAAIDRYPTHVRAHPPGLVVALWWLDRAGLGGPWAVATLQHVAAASAVPAVLVAVRQVASHAAARRIAPFLVLLPAAFAVGSGDAIFLGVGAWAVTAAIVATGARRGSVRSIGSSVAAGLLGAAALLLSYGLVLLGAVPAAIAVRRRRVDVLVVATAIATAMLVVAWIVTGFSWWDGFAATRREYAESVARSRPYAFYLVANLAAFAIALGPAVVAALPRLRDRRLWLLVGGGLAAIALADLSGLSKAEVERIWLPFAPWIAVATAVVAGGDTVQRWLVAQACWAIGVAMLIRSPW